MYGSRSPFGSEYVPEPFLFFEIKEGNDMKSFVKSTLFMTSFSPIFLLLGAVLIIKGSIVQGVSSLTIFVLFSILGWLLVVGAEKYGERLPITLKEIESNDSIVIPYLFSYCVPGALKYFDFGNGLVWAAIGIIYVIGMTISYFPAHPVLKFLGYSFYKCKTDSGNVVTIIARRQVRKKETLNSVVRVAENLFVEAKNK